MQRLRAAGHLVDVIAVTSARDADVVRHAVAQGVVLYLLKPFTFAAFRAKLEQYAAYRAELAAAPAEVVQDEVDRLLGSLRAGAAARPAEGDEPGDPARRHGRAARRRARRCRRPRWPRRSAPPGSPSAATSSTSPTPAASSGSPRYGGGGRPEVEYRWR